MAGYSPAGRLREFLRRGGQAARAWTTWRRRSPPGAGAVAAEQSRRHPAEVKELLDQAVLAERKQLARTWTTTPRVPEMRLDGPAAVPGGGGASSSRTTTGAAGGPRGYEQIKDLLGPGACSTSASPG
jgi:uncharacterized protein with von Willebrand factor type A (vWA) domain